MGGMRGALPAKDSVLSFPAFGQAGHHRLGPGKLSLRRKRRRRDAEANLRSVLHPALFSETRCHDRSKNDLYDVRRQREIIASDYLPLPAVIGYQLSDCRAGTSTACPRMASGSACPTEFSPLTPDLATVATALRAVATINR